jgi:hypothetical protein
VAGSKLGQDSIQNIFENQQKQAYADYLDRMPKAGQTAAEKFRTPLEGSDGWYYDYNPETRQWVKTDVPVSKKKLDYGPPGGFPNTPVIVVGPNGPEVQSFNKGSGRVNPAVPQGQAPPIQAEAARKAAETQAKEDKRVVELGDKIEGKVIDKTTKKPMGATAAEVEEFNQKSNTPYAYIVEQEVKKGWFSNDTTEKYTKRPLPAGVTASGAYKGYKNFTAKGGKGSFDAYIYALEQEMSK